MSNALLPTHMQKHDAECVTRLVSEALRRGYKVSVNDGEEWTVKLSTDPAVIFPAIGSTDMDRLRFRGPTNGTVVGTFDLIWGNGPGETISDHTIAGDGICEELFDYANKPWAA